MESRTTLLTLFIAATGLAIAACDHTTKPSSITNAVTFEFEGAVTESCEVHRPAGLHAVDLRIGRGGRDAGHRQTHD